MARSSVSPAQLSKRTGYLEGRFELPLSAALLADVLTVPADATVAEFVSNHVVLNRQRAAAVLDDGRYVGYCVLRDAASVPREEWDDRLVTEVMRTNVPIAKVGWRLREALAAMDRVDMDRLAVLDGAGAFIGEIRRSEIFKLDELMDDAGS
jgi:predicted transcriptional regulator